MNQTMRFFTGFPLPYLFYPLLFLLTFHVKLTLPVRNTYIVHMDKLLMPKTFTSYDKWYSSIIQSVINFENHTSSKSSPSLIYTYDNALNGFSALLSVDELESLKKFPGFVAAYSDKSTAMIDTTYTPEFLSLNPSADLWPASSFGKDIIIGVLDTGVWPKSLSFKDKGMTTTKSKWKGLCEGGQDFNSSMCNSKLIGIRYFN
jgi:hypothetical protein